MIFRFVLIFLFLSFNAHTTDCEQPKMPTDDEWNNWLSNIKKEIGRIRDIKIHPVSGKIFFLAQDKLWLFEKK